MTKMKESWEVAADRADSITDEQIEKQRKEDQATEKKEKQLTKQTKVRNVFPSHLNTIERVYAEGGMVRVVTKEGEEKFFKPEEALERLKALKKMNDQIHIMNPALRASHKELLVKIAEAYYEAMSQQEAHFKSRKDKQFQNFVYHKDLKGRPIDEGSFTEENMEHYLKSYHKLKAYEVEAVLKSKYPVAMKKKLMKARHMQRLKEDGFR